MQHGGRHRSRPAPYVKAGKLRRAAAVAGCLTSQDDTARATIATAAPTDRQMLAILERVYARGANQLHGDLITRQAFIRQAEPGRETERQAAVGRVRSPDAPLNRDHPDLDRLVRSHEQ